MLQGIFWKLANMIQKIFCEMFKNTSLEDVEILKLSFCVYRINKKVGEKIVLVPHQC